MNTYLSYKYIVIRFVDLALYIRFLLVYYGKYPSFNERGFYFQMRSVFKKKKGGVVGDLVSGTGGLVILVVIILVITSTLLGANLLTSGSAEDNAAQRLSGNFTEGINNVSLKIPTILLIGAVVLLFGVLVLLVAQARRSGLMGGGNASL